MIDTIESITSGNGGSFGNFFLTDNWKLYIHFHAIQHEIAMRELNIHPSDLLVSGFFHDDIILFRGVPGLGLTERVRYRVSDAIKERKSK